MSGRKIITVFGATGTQGGSIAQTFLKDAKLKDWKIRGVTRNVGKESAKKLAAQGVEIVSVRAHIRELCPPFRSDEPAG